MLAGNQSAASQAKSNNARIIARQPKNWLYEFPCSVMVVQYLPLWWQELPLPNNGSLMQSLVACRVSIWHFWSQLLKFRLCFDALGFFRKSKRPVKILLVLYFFQSERFGLGKTLSEVHIHYKSLPTGIYDHAGYKEYCRDFTAAPKVLDVFNMKQMYDSVFTGKENAYKNWNCIVLMFLTSFSIYICLVVCFMWSLYVLGLLSGLFWLFWDKVWLF